MSAFVTSHGLPQSSASKSTTFCCTSDWSAWRRMSS
jgi:hypothetical protein